MNKNKWVIGYMMVWLAFVTCFVLHFHFATLPVEAAVRARFERDTGSNITVLVRKSVEELRRKAEIEHNPAIQIGKIHGKVQQEEQDDHWYGNLRVRMAAEYVATFGLSYDLIEKGLRIEKDHTTTGLVVIVSSPQPLAVAVDTGTMHVEDRHKSGLRTWSKQGELESRAQRQMTGRATEDAGRRCRGADALETTRSAVRDLVLDMAGELYSRRMKRELASRILVIFEHELDQGDLRRRTEQPRG